MRKNQRQVAVFHKINLQNILDFQQNYYFYTSGNIAVFVMS
jgi:hypothetical protein